MSTNKKLEDLFGMAPAEDALQVDSIDLVEEAVTEETVTKALSTSNKTLALIEQALPAVQELAQIDKELDAIASKAMATFEELNDLGMQIDIRYAPEIFSVASSMMGHAINAKTAKANRKLKTIELQMRKIRLEMDVMKNAPGDSTLTAESFEQAEGKVLSRNELMEQLLGPRGASNTEK